MYTFRHSAVPTNERRQAIEGVAVQFPDKADHEQQANEDYADEGQQRAPRDPLLEKMMGWWALKMYMQARGLLEPRVQKSRKSLWIRAKGAQNDSRSSKNEIK